MSDWQTPAAFLLVALAALYLGRNLLRAARAFRQGRGCGAGCGKCALGGAKPARAAERPGVIPLAPIAAAPKEPTG